MAQCSQNICFSLWYKNVPKEEWVLKLCEWLGCSQQRASGLLRGTSPLAEELVQLAEKLQVEEEDLLYSDFLLSSGISVWQENLVYLISTLEHGGQKKLAEKLGTEPATITRWAKKQTLPSKKSSNEIGKAFGLPPTYDLTTEPLFLSPSPIVTSAQKLWLHEQIDKMDSKILQLLFPALERLLSDRET